MSSRQWKKQKALRQRDRRREQRVERDTFGQLETLVGAKLIVTVCPACNGRTTEIWALANGKLGCGRCVGSRSLVWLAFAQEDAGDERKTHVVAPSEPITLIS